MTLSVADRIFRRVSRFHTERIATAWGGRHILHGRKPTPGEVVLTSNDYLALAREPRIVAAMCASLQDTGGAAAPSGVFLHGVDHPQIMLEKALAEHMRAAGGILCQSGWDANVGLMQSIADAQSPVYVDHIAHMSLWHGAKTAGAPVYPFRHNFPGHLRDEVRKHGPGIVVVDAVYSTNGSRCPLTQICDVAEETGSVLVVDESHSLGTDGPQGAGMVVALGLAERVPFRIASLATAFAGRAGFIATNNIDFVDYFKMESDPAVFSATLLPHDIAGLAATLDVIRADDWRRVRLREVAAVVRRALMALEFDLEGSASHIVALQTGPDQRTIAIRDFLEARGVFGSVFCWPATARDRALIRFSMHAGLTDTQLDRLIQSCTEVRNTFGGMAPSHPEKPRPTPAPAQPPLVPTGDPSR
ncbi:quorum-sensing autoinducer CAI-1 synthase [Nocardia sp. NBC_00565]|uniref:alpha-hydroxyketone-type quorum-sensing autoinducer synthase n=1 Tax=Nocardia sp. NBC_00565 TaxID=2975993 RepID=UPI002E80A808|nr:alpha-hydroxyketone-type quorum-sensing autoinducer synthase [Nocardia sp. NBC_00565]WUC04932.1 quorum-sensing autoinducer CAI-1 synthase [Nocardia sp. NBC_00565]